RLASAGANASLPTTATIEAVAAFTALLAVALTGLIVVRRNPKTRATRMTGAQRNEYVARLRTLLADAGAPHAK
ncbi:hypothetical protein NO135_24225, partial [Clostridioides difficile]|nr:hypothetical protein [Clostridioides difficile]